jgi:uncharacterized protein
MPGTGSLTTILIAGFALALAAYLTVMVATAHRFTTAARIAVPAPPSSSLRMFDRIMFASRHDRIMLAAWYHAAPAARGAVILVHGRDACRGSELRGPTFMLAEHLVGIGFSVVMLDLRGHGDSTRARVTFGRNERHDILGALDFLLERGHQPGAIGVLGASMGGAGAIAATAEDPAIGAVIADSAFADLHALLHRRFTRLTRMPRFMLRGSLAAARLLTGVDLTANPPSADMAKLRGRPALVIHAAFDPFVPVADARVLAHAGGSELWITGADRHLGSFGHGRDEYVQVIARFFSRHLLRADDTTSGCERHAILPEPTESALRRIALVPSSAPVSLAS